MLAGGATGDVRIKAVANHFEKALSRKKLTGEELFLHNRTSAITLEHVWLAACGLKETLVVWKASTWLKVTSKDFGRVLSPEVS